MGHDSIVPSTLKTCSTSGRRQLLLSRSIAVCATSVIPRIARFFVAEIVRFQFGTPTSSTTFMPEPIYAAASIAATGIPTTSGS